MRARLALLRRQPIISIGLVAINVAVFLLCKNFGKLIYMGDLDPVRVLNYNEYGRILWSIFLHNGIDHLFNNMLILFFLGSMIENEVGHVRYAVLYFLSGIGGSLVSLYAKVVNNEFAASVGASGAIFGLDGALLAMVLFSDKRMENVTMPRVLLMITCSLYNGFVGGNIDNAAHVGGLITGFAAATAMCVFRRWRHRGNRYYK
ncbi:MAG: rhomboid family intramembrane serine protease [Lachnospiraceae bacterium]|nr:rhomboid family intramembrane serine protease [Lachnospiraceae bacterium]